MTYRSDVAAGDSRRVWRPGRTGIMGAMRRDLRRRWLLFVVLVGVPVGMSYVLPLKNDMILISAVALFGGLALVSVARSQLAWSRRRRLPPPPNCRRCGYSLRGNTSGVCPECGTPTGAAG